MNNKNKVMKIKGKRCKDWTIDELKKYLKKRGEKVGGSKVELCKRLKESLKHKAPIKTKKEEKQTVKKNKGNVSVPRYTSPKTTNAEFRFYGSLYYQIPGGKMAPEFLKRKYGFNKEYLNKFNTFDNLIKNINK